MRSGCHFHEQSATSGKDRKGSRCSRTEMNRLSPPILNNCAHCPPQFFTTSTARAGPCPRGPRCSGRHRQNNRFTIGNSHSSRLSNPQFIVLENMAINSSAVSFILTSRGRGGAVFEPLPAAWCIRTWSVGRSGASGAIAAGLKRSWRENSRLPDGTLVEVSYRKSKCESGQ